MVVVAVKVTGVPAHTGLADAPTDTLTGRFDVTVIVIAFEEAGLPVTQPRLEVSTQVT